MNNIEFWIYIIFALIYFIARGMRGKSKNKKTPERPQPTDESQQKQSQPSMSFEDLLEEITGKRSMEKPEDPIDETDFEEIEEVEPDEPVYEEGRDRRFMDEESKRVYEESIKRAEGANLEYEPDENFASTKLMPTRNKEEEVNPLAQDIRDILSDPDNAKKAIILQEILNRKY